MQFIVSQIQKQAVNGPLNFDEQVDVQQLQKMHDDIRNTDPAHVYGECYVDGDEIYFQLNIVGQVILPCALTLVDVPYSFHITKTEIFSTSPYYGKEEEEDDIHQVQGEVIDLTPLILENIILELPYRVYSDDQEVLTNAVVKGDGWSLETEHQQETEEIDPRLKKLKQFFNEENKSDS